MADHGHDVTMSARLGAQNAGAILGVMKSDALDQAGQHILDEARGRFKMKLPRRNFLHLVAGAAALPTISCIARAQTYPTRPVRIMAFPTAARRCPHFRNSWIIDAS